MQPDHIQRHMNVCTKNRGLDTDKVQIHQPILTEEKSVIPKISAFANEIIDDDPSSKDKSFLELLIIPPAPKTLTSNKLFPVKNTSPRVDDDEYDDITDTRA